MLKPLLALFLLLCPVVAQAESRSVVPLIAEWQFMKGDVKDAEAFAFDDRQWLPITLPHTFNAGDGESADYYRGPSWYRRSFEVKAVRSDRRVFVQFDGAALRSDLWVNGRYVGRHDGGHAGFRFDITRTLRAGRNQLAVRVDNSKIAGITPLGGDFTVFGGLYRPVSLIEVDNAHFDLKDHGGPGVYARVGELNGEAATILVQVRVANDGRKRRRVPIVLTLLDAQGRAAAIGRRSIELPPNVVGTTQVRLDLARPRLWDGVRDPYLYRLVARLGDGGDEVAVPVGVRSFRFDPERGFILNGRPYPLHGANLMHSARPGKGTAVSDTETAEDFAILREMGSTGVRLVHFQHPQAAYDEADRLGLVAMTEIGLNGEAADTPEFRANAAEQLRELIAQNYNQPSVVMWGLGNEIYSTEPHVLSLLEELNRVAERTDPTRPTVYAHCCQADDHPKAMVTDLIAFNRYFGWYPTRRGRSANGPHVSMPHILSGRLASANMAPVRASSTRRTRRGSRSRRVAGIPSNIRRSTTRGTGASCGTSPISGARSSGWGSILPRPDDARATGRESTTRDWLPMTARPARMLFTGTRRTGPTSPCFT
jgi:beta-galactosidase